MASRGDGVYLRNQTWWLDFSHRGQRHYIRLGAHISRTAARELARVTRAKILQGEAGIGEKLAAAPVTVQTYAATWLTQIEVEPKTLDGYRQMLDYYILPALGTADLVTLDRKTVKAFLGQLRTAGRSKNTVRLVRATLSVLCEDAIEAEVRPKDSVNPAKGLGRRGRSGPGTISQAERRAKIRPLAPAQLEHFLQQTTERPLDRTLFLVLADAGLRPGEALALRWTDLDEVEQTLQVERALSGQRVKLTKSGESRAVEITPRLRAALLDWQAHQEARALAENREPSPYLFTDPAGAFLDVKVIARRFRRLCQRAGLPRFRLYDLRHTYATNALAAGAPITYVAAQLGHAKATTTLSYYAHWLPTAERVWGARLEQYRLEQIRREIPAGLPASGLDLRRYPDTTPESDTTTSE